VDSRVRAVIRSNVRGGRTKATQSRCKLMNAVLGHALPLTPVSVGEEKLVKPDIEPQQTISDMCILADCF
jgi:hypothetical protein